MTQGTTQNGDARAQVLDRVEAHAEAILEDIIALRVRVEETNRRLAAELKR